MTITVPLKAGEVLVPIAPNWSGYKQIKLVNSHRFKGRLYWWFEMTSTSNGIHLDSLTEDTLRSGWRRASTFYQIGKKYKFRSGQRADVWQIIELYQIDGYYGDKKKAVAWLLEDGVKTDVQTLNQSDFDRMVEA